MSKKLVSIVSIVVASLIVLTACQVVKDVSNTLANIKRLEFKLGNINNFSLSGVNLSNKSQLNDFSVTDALKLTNAYKNKSLDSRFTLNVKARNPNDGNGTAPKTSATIQNMQWKLFIDDVETISGDLNSPVVVPGSGQESVIPLNINLDLYDFFSNRSYDNLLNLALTLAGNKSTESKVKLSIKPTVSTSIGPISYPGWLTVVDKEWTNQ